MNKPHSRNRGKSGVRQHGKALEMLLRNTGSKQGNYVQVL
jgi:hypothetical protein